MVSNTQKVNNDTKQLIEEYLTYWKEIIFSILIALVFAFTYLRYTSYEYSASAIIKIRDEQQSKKLPSLEEFSNKGLFSDGADKIKDEIKTIQSRTITKSIIKKLNLNISYFSEGKIKEQELYKTSPIEIKFFESDSVIDKVEENLIFKIVSDTEFIMFEDEGNSLLDRDQKDGKKFSFGDKVDTPYGGFLVIPDITSISSYVGKNIRVNVFPVELLVNIYSKKVEISTEPGSSIISLNLKETVAQKAVDYLNQLIIEYNKDVLADKAEVVRVTSDFINNRLEQVAEELGQVESDAEKIQKNYNLTDLGAQNDLNLQARKQLEQQINTTSTNIQMISYLQEEINDKDKISDMIPANIGVGDGNTNQIIKNHNELVAQRDKLLKNSSERNPTVIQLNNQIDALRINLQNSLESMKETSKLSLENLENESRRISGQLYSAPAKERRFRSIQRQKDIKESLFLYLLEKREESAIRLGMDSPIAKTIDKAYSSYIPVSPNPKMTYIATFLIGLFIPIGFIYILKLIDTKIHIKNDLTELLPITYLGDVPKTSKKQKLVKKVDYSPKAEAFRIIRSNIDFILKDIGAKTKKLFITSTKAQEGKSHTSTNLASSISFSEKSVLLIEMDIRVPKILEYLEIKEKPKKGLSDYLADNSIKPNDIIFKHPENKYLDIIPSGTIPPNPSELLMSPRVSDLFKYMESKYDYIIADTSAVGLVSDTLLISEFADMFVYVVSVDNVDKRKLVNVILPLYNDKRLPKITMLLNGVKQGKKGYGYGYGYGKNPNKKKKWYNFS